MRMLLIVVNILLACYLAYGAFTFFGGSTSDEPVYTVKTRTEKKVTEKNTPRKVEITPFTGDAVAVISTQNIFDSSRCSAVSSWRDRAAQVTMTLVGTFQVDEDIGAIILMKQRSNERREGPPVPGEPPPAPPVPPNAATANTSRASTRNGSNRSRFGTSRWNFQNNHSATASTEGNTTTYKQYIRKGERLENGYVLAEVTRSSVTLTRGNEKLELEIQDASVNAPATVAANANAARQNQRGQRNGMQEFVRIMDRMQRMQNAQMLGVMRTLQNNNNNNNRNSRSRNTNSNNNNNSGGRMGGFGGGPPGPGGWPR